MASRRSYATFLLLKGMLKSRTSKLTSALAAAGFLLLAQPFCGNAATWSWNNVTGNWELTSSWIGGVIPPSDDFSTVLNFAGDVGTAAAPTTYIATNDFAGSFQLNQLILNGTDASPITSGLSHSITGNQLQLGGASPSVMMNGSASFGISAPVHLTTGLTSSGNGTGTVTFNGKLSGFADITKQGTSTLRFGTSPVLPATAAPSENTWMGQLVISAGIVRFNNNAQAGATALRANPVVFTGAATLTIKRDNGDQTDNFATSLRMGTLSGNTGSVVATVEGTNTDNYDIVITALRDGTYGGGVVLPAPLGLGNDGGALTIRGTANQTLTGTINIHKDVVISNSATLTLRSNASLSAQTSGAVTFAGGSLVLDNTAGNFAAGRLRDGSTSSTTVETIGGGSLTLLGNTLSGTTEITGRLQLGSSTKLRSGHLALGVVHNSLNNSTDLTFYSYSRDQSAFQQLATVDFTAANAAGTVLNLGQNGANPHIRLTLGTFVVPLSNSLLSATGGTASVGWATVNGSSFAGYDANNGVIAASTVAWSMSLPSTSNALITGDASTPETTYTLNSIKIAPTAIGQQLNISGAGNIATTAILLTGAIDFLITSTTTGGIAGGSPRFFTVQSATLTVASPLAVVDQPIVKTGRGTLALNNPTNTSLTATTSINQGTLRAHPGTSLPRGELRFRGGVLEITEGSTFARNIGYGAATVNWSGLIFDPLANGGLGGEVNVDEDRGSGGFAAFGADAFVDLNEVGATAISWEDPGFVRSGYALILGSLTATHRITFVDSINLTAAVANSADVNYNAREIRVPDNPATIADWAQISGSISGATQNDLLKTGSGTLELSADNFYAGATLVQEGTLLITGNNSTSFVHDVKAGAILGGSGIIGAVRIEPGGELAPGMQTSLASILSTGDLTFLDSTAKLTIGIGGSIAGGDSLNGHDQIIVTGSVTLNNADLSGSLLNSYTATGGDRFFIILNDGSDPVQGQFADGSQIAIGSQNFRIFYSADSDTTSLTGGNDIALEAIPEPSAALLLALGALTCTRRRRK